MTSITVSDIEVAATPSQLVKYRPSGRLTTPLATSVSGPSPAAPKEGDPVISLYQPTSGTAFDPRCRHSLLLSTAETSRNPLFHQACIYIPEHDELYVTSDLLQTTSSNSLPVVLISRVNLRRRGRGGESRAAEDDDIDNEDDDPVGGSDDDVVSAEWQKLRPPQSMAMPAGGTRYPGGGMVFCSQGGLADGTPGGLYLMPRGKPPEALVTGFHGRRFNSPHDVAASARDGALWFTDPRRGFELGFRPRPVLPCRVYRFHPGSEDLRVVADGLERPLGIAFSSDEGTVYITDADGGGGGEGDVDEPRASTIYAFDVMMRADSPFLANKRVFAVPTTGIAASVKCDQNGFVYAGCSGGIEIWNSGGMLQAVVEIPGGVTSFCFGRQDETRREMFVCAEQRLWRLRFGCRGRSILPIERAGWFEWNDRTAIVTAMPQANDEIETILIEDKIKAVTNSGTAQSKHVSFVFL